MMYTFGRSYHRLQKPDFDPTNHEAMHESSKLLPLMTHVFWLFKPIQYLPESILSRMGNLATLVELKNVGLFALISIRFSADETTARACESK